MDVPGPDDGGVRRHPGPGLRALPAAPAGQHPRHAERAAPGRVHAVRPRLRLPQLAHGDAPRGAARTGPLAAAAVPPHGRPPDDGVHPPRPPPARPARRVPAPGPRPLPPLPGPRRSRPAARPPPPRPAPPRPAPHLRSPAPGVGPAPPHGEGGRGPAGRRPVPRPAPALPRPALPPAPRRPCRLRRRGEPGLRARSGRAGGGVPPSRAARAHGVGRRPRAPPHRPARHPPADRRHGRPLDGPGPLPLPGVRRGLRRRAGQAPGSGPGPDTGRDTPQAHGPGPPGAPGRRARHRLRRAAARERHLGLRGLRQPPLHPDLGTRAPR
ncbi:hypothetical protein STENM223S_08626 [Streptomyces tendae]